MPGKEGAGIVAAIGSGVTHVGRGDRVMVQVEHGTFAEQAVVPQDECYVIPDGIPFDQAASLGIAFQTAYFALLDRAQIRTGETVLVTGASGSVGIAAIQLAKVFGTTVIAGLTTPSKERNRRSEKRSRVRPPVTVSWCRLNLEHLPNRLWFRSMNAMPFPTAFRSIKQLLSESLFRPPISPCWTAPKFGPERPF